MFLIGLLFAVDSDFIQGVKKVFGSDDKKELVDPYFVLSFAGKKVTIYTIILLKSVCRCSQTAGRNSCSTVSGDISNCPYRLTVHTVTSSCLSSA